MMPTDGETIPTPSLSPHADAAGVGERSAENDLNQLLACNEINAVIIGTDLKIKRLAAATSRLPGLDPARPPKSLGDLADWARCPELLTDARGVLETGDEVSRNLKLPESETHLALRFYASRSEASVLDGLVLTIADITERWNANTVAAHLAAIVENSDDAILSKDLNGVITSWNRGAQRLFGYTAEETIGLSVTLLIPAGMPDEEPAILERIRRGEAIDHYQTKRLCKNRDLVDVSLCVSPIRDTEGRVVGASKIARDVTLEKHAQHQREVLINELNHRVKNTLATVQSIAYQSMRYATTVEAFGESFNARLLALSKTQDLLTNGNWIAAPLRELISNELAPYRSESNEVNLSGSDIQLKPRMLMALGMLIHELTTNAVKYGALSVPGGHVDVSWQTVVTDSAGHLSISWMEQDGPPIHQPPTRKGMGSRLLETVVGGLGGTSDLQYALSGLRCVIDMPWTNDEVDE